MINIKCNHIIYILKRKKLKKIRKTHCDYIIDIEKIIFWLAILNIY